MKIFISAGHGGLEENLRDPGAIAANTTEAAELFATRDLILLELKSRNLTVLSPDDNLSLRSRIEWINSRGGLNDVALEINMNAFDNPELRGVRAYYIAMNPERKQQADLIISNLITRIPELPDRGVKPDTSSALGSLAFCREVIPSSLVIELGFLTNPQDLRLLQTRRREYAIALADGVKAWLEQVSSLNSLAFSRMRSENTEIEFSGSGQEVPNSSFSNGNIAIARSPLGIFYPSINIRINGQSLPQFGIVAAGNAYIPEDILKSLGISEQEIQRIPQIKYKNIIYLQAIALRDFDISVVWEADTRTVIIKTIFKVCVGAINRIMGYGNASENQLRLFLQNNHSESLSIYDELPRLYREEAYLEGVNHDIAFCQMCLETNFLTFRREIGFESNTFVSLDRGESNSNVKFPNPRMEVRAHIQHLKAYASNSPLVKPIIDPNFKSVNRGSAVSINQLSGVWANDLNYGTKILAIVRRLYEFMGIL